MKLIRYGEAGAEQPALLHSDGTLRSLSPLIKNIDADVLSPGGLQFLSALDPSKLPVVDPSVRLGCPIGALREIFAIGLNYRDHAMEAAMPIPEEPVVFSKSTSSVCGPNDDIRLPPGSSKTDWEIELGIVIGTRTSSVDEDAAWSSIAGYCMVNDVSERDWQLHRGGQWGKGKSFDTFSPIGPWLVTADEVGAPDSLSLELSVNGERRQQGNTKNMIFPVNRIVSYLSHVVTLQPGDLIITGTPAGVGLGMKPPQFLKSGDVIDMAITGLGTQRHRVIAGAPVNGSR